jgi:hypothetical protein
LKRSYRIEEALNADMIRRSKEEKRLERRQAECQEETGQGPEDKAQEQAEEWAGVVPVAVKAGPDAAKVAAERDWEAVSRQAPEVTVYAQNAVKGRLTGWGRLAMSISALSARPP